MYDAGILKDRDELIKKRTAREILSIIEDIYFHPDYKEFRINQGSNGVRNLIIQTIKDEYDVG